MPKTNSNGVPSNAGFRGVVFSADGTVHQLGVHEATGDEVEVAHPHPERVTPREANARESAAHGEITATGELGVVRPRRKTREDR